MLPSFRSRRNNVLVSAKKHLAIKRPGCEEPPRMRRVERLLVLKFYYIKNDSPDFNVTLELKSVLELKRNLLNRDIFVPAPRSAGGAAELVSLNNLFS